MTDVATYKVLGLHRTRRDFRAEIELLLRRIETLEQRIVARERRILSYVEARKSDKEALRLKSLKIIDLNARNSRLVLQAIKYRDLFAKVEQAIKRAKAAKQQA